MTPPAKPVKVSVSKETDWKPEKYAKAPIELLLCEDLQASTKLLWIVLANQTNFGPIHKSMLDKLAGIHRSTRLRCLAELREIGLVKGTEHNLILVDPIPILRKRIEELNKNRQDLQSQFLGPEKIVPETKKKKTQPKERPSNSEKAKQAWNSYRPKNYQKVNVLSAAVVGAIDKHMDSLGIEKNDYEQFFSVLKAGIEHSDFWLNQNSTKTLQSITGIGNPQEKKFNNVFQLYNEGLNHEKGCPLEESERKDDMVISIKYRPLIDDYDEIQTTYAQMYWYERHELPTLTDRIIEIENGLREAGLDPARFRMANNIPTWPTDVPEPDSPRERFWRYTEGD